MGFFDTVSKPFSRIPESFIGNNKPRKVRKSVSKLENLGDKNMAKKIQKAKATTGKWVNVNDIPLPTLPTGKWVNVNDIKLGKGMSNIVAKPIVVKKQKVERATLNQKMCLYALTMKQTNNKQLAKEISNSCKTRESASNKIAELLKQ